MSEQPDELQKLVSIATDLGLSSDLRVGAIKQMAKLKSHEALLALLAIVANDRLIRQERELALKQAGEILKSSRQ